MTLGVMNGETITVIRGTKNSFGDPIAGATHLIEDCAIYPVTTTEVVAGEDVVVWGLTVLVPEDSDVLPTDRVTARGVTYEVSGQPMVHRSPITGRTSCVEIHLVAATG